MHTLYTIVCGPLLWIAMILFIGGSLYRVWQLYSLARRKENFIFSYLDLRYSLKSLLHWLTPFGATSMRIHPVMTVVGFAFHICLLMIPIFLSAHIVMWDEAWNVQWWALPEAAAEGMTLVVIASCGFFLVRRLTRPEVRYVTTVSDFLLLAMVAAPFVSGFYCLHQWPGYTLAHFLHIISAEVMLAAIPFTRLSHMFLIFFTRAYTGSEFGAVRHARDW